MRGVDWRMVALVALIAFIVALAVYGLTLVVRIIVLGLG